MDNEYWFIVTATFACPVCQTMHTEKLVLNSPTTDVEKLRARVDSQIFACPSRQTQLPKGTPVAIDISPPYTRESLEAMKLNLIPLPGK